MKRGLYATFMGLIVTFISVIAYNLNLSKPINEWISQKQLLEEYGQGELEIPESYLEGNSLQTKFSHILHSKIDLLHFIVGMPGSGKTTAMCYAIN